MPSDLDCRKAGQLSLARETAGELESWRASDQDREDREAAASRSRPCGSGALRSRPWSERGVYLNTVRKHGVTRYYARTAVEFKNGGKMRWVVGWFGIRGGTVAWSQFPAVWPYL